MHATSVFNNDSLADIPSALRQCERSCVDVCLELQLRGSLDADKVNVLQQAIQANTRITSVKFRVHGEWEEVSATNRAIVSQLVEQTGYLPNLKEMVIVGDFLPIPAITSFLYHANKVQTIRLERFRNLKSCDNRVLVAFCDALRQHGALQWFSLMPWIAGPEAQEDTFLNLLLGALGAIPTLEQVEIVTNVKVLSGPPLVSLCNSTHLQRLELNPQEAVGTDGIEALARNTSIQELLISCTYSDQALNGVLLLIQRNQTLNRLTMVFHEAWRNDDSYDQYILPIAEMLETNSSLSHLTISMGKHPYPSLGVLKAFVDIFKSNYTLHYLDLFEDVSRVQRTSYDEIEGIQDETAKAALLLGKRIQYYTILNRSGRGELLGGNNATTAAASRAQWVEKLVEFSYSVERLYFFIRANPTLCNCSTTTCSEEEEERTAVAVESEKESSTSITSARKRCRLKG